MEIKNFQFNSIQLKFSNLKTPRSRRLPKSQTDVSVALQMDLCSQK